MSSCVTVRTPGHGLEHPLDEDHGPYPYTVPPGPPPYPPPSDTSNGDDDSSSSSPDSDGESDLTSQYNTVEIPSIPDDWTTVVQGGSKVVLPVNSALLAAKNSILELLQEVEEARIKLEECTLGLAQIIRAEMKALSNIKDPKLKKDLRESLLELDACVADRDTGKVLWKAYYVHSGKMTKEGFIFCGSTFPSSCWKERIDSKVWYCAPDEEKVKTAFPKDYAEWKKKGTP